MADLATLSRAWVKSPDYIEMTGRQMAVLAILCDEPGPHRVRNLATAINASKPVITRIHNRLGAAGLVQRTANPDDLRDCQIVATDAGRALRQAMKALAAKSLSTKEPAMTKTAQAFRQGDVPLIPYTGDLGAFTEVPPTPEGKHILALGEVTGHHHRFEHCSFQMDGSVRMFRDFQTGAQVVEIPAGGASLIHEEHTAIPMEPGRYLQLVQVEDTGEMISQVAD